jgi:hypothetical protein
MRHRVPDDGDSTLPEHAVHRRLYHVVPRNLRGVGWSGDAAGLADSRGRRVANVLLCPVERSGAGLQHQVQGRLRGAADRAEAALEHHLAQAGLASLCAQSGAAGL